MFNTHKKERCFIYSVTRKIIYQFDNMERLLLFIIEDGNHIIDGKKI